jgi:DNA-binding NarL/FixJ family response regulator
MCASDDLVLFYGAGMADELKRFSTETFGALPPAVILAPRLDWDDVHQALDHGAAGYLLEKPYTRLLLGMALLSTARGGCILDPVIAAEQVRAAARARAVETCASVSRLTPQERHAMELLAAGLQIREVAGEMFLTEKTVRNYLSRVYAKLGVRSQSEAILRWLGHLEAPGSAGDAGSPGEGRAR